MSEKLLEVNDLRYSYDGTNPALEVKNFSILKGERLCVLGANGAGKSTFFLCLNGVLNPSGKICYRGTEITKKHMNELRKNIGIVFQDADKQIIASTVGAEVSFGPMNLKLPREEVERRVNMALSYMNIKEMSSRPPHYLSGGEKKRVCIADIIAMESEIIIFDEPTASLDPLNIEIFEGVLKKLEDEEKTIVVSTHDVDFAYRWANRIIIIHDGKIVADGEPEQIFGDIDILQKSNLKQPMLMKVSEILKERGILPEEAFPNSIDMFEKLFKK